MIQLDLYTCLGCAVELLAKSEYHSRLNFNGYIHREILPPMRHQQMKIYLTDEGIPTALLTWAWLSSEVEKDVVETGRAFYEHEWNCGNHLFVNDWISPYGNMRELLHDLSANLFPER